jgi:hypothetical protein
MIDIEAEQAEQTAVASRGWSVKRFLVPALAGVMILGFALGTVMILNLQGDVGGLRSDQAASQKATDKNQASLIQVQSQLKTLAGADGAGVDLGKMQTELRDLTAKLKADEAKLKKICDGTSVAAQVANINGQMSANDNPNYTYYSNFTQTIYSICGSE